MSRLILRGGSIVGENEIFPADLYIEDDRIAAIVPRSAAAPAQDSQTNTAPQWDAAVERDVSGLKIFPGLIDIHFHGARGHDFTEGTAEALSAAARDAVCDGVTSFAASLTVLSHKRMLEVLRGLAQEYRAVPPENGISPGAPSLHCAKRPLGAAPCPGGARFLGVHSEGPFISKEYKALMDPKEIRAPDIQELSEMLSAARPPAGGAVPANTDASALILMTFSPHYENVPELLEAAKRHNLTMMIGHSAASAGEACAALDKGAAGYTHLYNAMSGHHHRNPGVVTAALGDSRGYAEIIADAIHVDLRVLEFTYRLLGSERLILVTDAMPGKSMADGNFVFSGLDCIKKDGKAWVKGNGSGDPDAGRLAGSVAPLNVCLRNVAKSCGANDTELARMASANPAKLLGLDNEIGGIACGKKADVACYDNGYNCVLTIVGGEIVHETAGAHKADKAAAAAAASAPFAGKA